MRGTKRDDAAALQLVSLVEHACASVLAPREVQGGDEVATLLVLLGAMPLKGRTVTMDAGLLYAETTQTSRLQQGDDAGVVKGNQGEILSVLDDGVAQAVLFPPDW